MITEELPTRPKKPRRPNTYQSWEEFPEDGLVEEPIVCGRYGKTRQAFKRWKKRADLGFPRPIKIGIRNYYKKSDLLAWELELARRSIA